MVDSTELQEFLIDHLKKKFELKEPSNSTSETSPEYLAYYDACEAARATVGALDHRADLNKQQGLPIGRDGGHGKWGNSEIIAIANGTFSAGQNARSEGVTDPHVVMVDYAIDACQKKRPVGLTSLGKSYVTNDGNIISSESLLKPKPPRSAYRR